MRESRARDRNKRGEKRIERGRENKRSGTRKREKARA